MAFRPLLSEACGYSIRFMQHIGRRRSCILAPQMKLNFTNTAVISSIVNNENVQSFPSLKKFCHTKVNSSPQPTDASIVQQTQIVDAEEKEDYDKLYRSIHVECRGNDKAVLKSYTEFVSAVAKHLEINMEPVKTRRYRVRRLSLLKSVFVHKKHQVQYEVRTHFIYMQFLRLTSSTTDTFLEYIQRNLPEGISMIVTKEELCSLPKFVQGSDEVTAESVT